MNYWTIKTFTTESGRKPVKDWMAQQPTGAQAAINIRLKYLQTQQVWGRPDTAKLKGKFKEIHEIRVKWQRNQYRPLGFFGPNNDDFTVLVGATEKGSKFEPKTAPEMADDRRKLVLKDGNKYAVKYFNDI